MAKKSGKQTQTLEPLRLPTARQLKGLVAVTCLALFMRFVALSYPSTVVFDEVHFGKFSTSYAWGHDRFFDIHPPHAKLLIAVIAKLGGYQGEADFSKIGLPYAESVPVAALRLVPALAGSLIPAAVILWLWLVGVSASVCLFAGFVLALDNALIVQSRVISLDNVLILCELLALCAYLIALKLRGKYAARALLAAGGLAAFAVGSKITGLAVVAMIAVHHLVRCCCHPGTWRDRFSFERFVLPVLLLVGAFLGVYLLGWVVHFSVLTLPGYADAFYKTTGSFFKDLLAVHQAMIKSNYNLKNTHPDSSVWWTWPMMKVAPFYWSKAQASIHLTGNPFVWWLTSSLFVLVLVRAAQSLFSAVGRRVWANTSWLFFGYSIALLPFMGIPRALFLYHYFTPLIFSLGVALVGLEKTEVWMRLSPTRRKAALVGWAALVVVGFLWTLPVTYGFYFPGWSEWVVRAIRALRAA